MAFNKNAVVLLLWQGVFQLIAGIRLTVTPSNNVEVNQTVTLKCELDPSTLVVLFVRITINGKSLCTLEPDNGSCRATFDSCTNRYTSVCNSETMYSVQIPIPKNWTGKLVVCETSDQKSNSVIFSVKVPVASVTLVPTPISVIAGTEAELNCTTSFCNPPANITWYMSSADITSQSSFTTDATDGLVKTTSSLLINAVKSDNGNQVYCTASNIPGQRVKSTVNIVTVLYKPEVGLRSVTPYIVTEGEEATLKCIVSAANPDTGIIWKWFKIDDSTNVLHNGSTFIISNIHRNGSGKYGCTATNSVGKSDLVTTDVDVKYKPEVASRTQSPYILMEGQTATLECHVIIANPRTIINWRWFKIDSPSKDLHNGSIYNISNIQRNKSGTYNCSAKNSIGISEPVSIDVDVQYKPEVASRTQSPYILMEGQTATLKCQVITANPRTIINWRWFKIDSPSKDLHNGSIYNISNIQRNKSGTYNCSAKNSIGISEPVSIDVDVQYKPEIVGKPVIKVNESDKIELILEVVSNPLSDVSWYDGSDLLYTQPSARNATYVKEKAMCTDTKNFTLLASNSVKRNVTASVELIVNCKPRPYDTNIILGVTDTSGIEFSTTVIAYPEPQYELQYDNGTRNYEIMSSITRNEVYNFTIYFNTTVVRQSDYGTYYIILHNFYGVANVSVNVVPQRKPAKPFITEFYCEVTRAKIQWISSFNGGDPQLFTVVALNSQQQKSKSDNISDKGENEIHSTYVENLQPSMAYMFYVSAQNRQGWSLSENVTCTTKEVPSDSFPMIAGGATAGGITLAIVVVVLIVLLRRYAKHEKQTVKSERLHQDGESDYTNDDGMRDNILYVSAGPSVDEKPEAVVYAAVNKTVPESNNNANLYAEVKKSGHIIAEGALYSDVKPKRGLFIKDVSYKKDGNPKKKKGKKQKSKQEEAEVYENSEDIAMSSKSDNVYSNSGQKVQNKEERGYKNKDGLLYVEVQFDAKTEKGNQTIHGKDEKTDYATVEFPVAASTHDE